ncbi:MAG: TIM barrel protein, partial [Armatimonadota bacterium]
FTSSLVLLTGWDLLGDVRRLLDRMGSLSMPRHGKANPIDALDVFGQHVRGVHAKDGEYPTDGTNLGSEKPMGEGRVNFPELVPKLKDCGYDGVLAIEREISGPKQIEDIKHAIEILKPLC